MTAKLGRPKKSKDIQCTCLTCGTEYAIPDWRTGGDKYCSRACFYESLPGKPRRKWAKTELKQCPNCGKEFMAGGTGRPKLLQKFCSATCQHEAHGYQPSPRQLSDIEAAWLAGLFDGEGCIAFLTNRPAGTIRLSITNTHYPLLERLVEVTGTGSIIEHKVYSDKHNTSWNWNCYSANARDLLKQMRPYLIVKAEKADLALSAE